MNFFIPSPPRVADFAVGYDRLEKLRDFGFTDEELYVLIAPRRTLDRRKASGEMLSPVESDRVQRIERIWAHGVRVFGEPERFARWLRSEIAALDDARPIDLLTSETGAQIVSEEIGRIDYGMLA